MIEFTKEQEIKSWEARKSTAKFKRNNLPVAAKDLIGNKQKEKTYTNKMERRSVIRKHKLAFSGRIPNELFIKLFEEVENNG